jgi:hypothetical protein
MQVRRLFFASLLLSTLCLTSCVQNSPISNTVIQGNWNLVGEENPSQYPLLNLTLVASGDSLYGSGNIGVGCLSSSDVIREGFSFSGQIASDGTFVLTNSSLDSLQVAIRGRVPAAGSKTWAGNFSITSAPAQTSCIVDDSGEFVASVYPALNGTYAGTITGQGFGSGITVSTQVSQGSLSSTPVPGEGALVTPFYIPLNTTVTVSGSPCFSAGTNAPLTMPPSTLSGDSFLLSYVMNDGSNLQLSGWFTDPSESTLHVQIAGVIGVAGITGGNCGGAFGSGTLIRQ